MTKGRCNGLTDAPWLMVAPLLPADPVQRGQGHPHTSWSPVCNTMLWVLITGFRWCDVPMGEQWGSRSVARRWLGQWVEEGILERVLQDLLERAELAGVLDWERLAADVFLEGRGEKIEYGFSCSDHPGQKKDRSVSFSLLKVRGEAS